MLLAASAIVLALPPAVTIAQLPAKAASVRPIRIEGYWGRERSAPGVLDGIRITSSTGGPRRIFGVTALQAYKPEEEGIQVLRQSSLQPDLRLLGREDMVRRFMEAPGTEKVVAFAVYNAANGTLALGSVQVGNGGER